MEILGDIHRVDEASNNIAHSNVYLIVKDKELVVVDTGTAGNAKKTVKYIQNIGRSPSEVSTIILTHYHMDHSGSAKALKDLTDAKVAVSAEDAEIVEGKKPYPKPRNLLLRVASFIKPEPVEVDLRLKDGDEIGKLKVIATPGHTEGSIMLLDTERKVLFTGDTLRFDGEKVTSGPKHFTWDETKEKESAQKIASFEFDVMLPGHGDFLKGKASEAVRSFAANL